MDTGVRDNCAVRLGLGTGSSFGTRATMGDDIEGADCHLIPPSSRGVVPAGRQDSRPGAPSIWGRKSPADRR